MANFKTSYTKGTFITNIIVLGITSLLIACSPSEIPVTTCPEVECPTVECPEQPLYEDLWAKSPHADVNSLAFSYWNDEDPAEIPEDCAKCHSRPGYVDFLGVDDTAYGIVDKPAKVGTTVSCFVCHNEVAGDLATVIFPSGEKIRGLGSDITCIECHQGRASTTQINRTLATLNLSNDDMASSELDFISSHYISGATSFGTEVKAAYEYDGKSYRGLYIRGDEFFSCIRCHDPHTQEVMVNTCGDCHTFNGEEVNNIRVDSTDYDGDGDIQEGISSEISEFQTRLWEAMLSYSKSTIGTPLAYDSKAYPYYFIDTNQDGEANGDEAVFMNRYNAWTPRLLRAAYNFNYASHDPGAYAHNSDYILQVLFDSIVDLAGDSSTLTRP